MNSHKGLSVCILRSRADPRRHYVGSAHHVARRLAEHNRGLVTATRANLPWELAVSLRFPEQQTARAFAKRHFASRES